MRLQAGSDWQNHGLVFTNEVGEPWKPYALRKSLDEALQRAELKHIKLYALRHSCASILMAEGISPKGISPKGISPKGIAERLGHSSTKTTLDNYAGVSPGLQEQATEKLENALFASVGTL